MQQPRWQHTEEIRPAPHHWALLPGAGFADSFRIRLTPQLAGLDTTELTAKMMAEQPAWVSGLMQLRDRLVAPLGLKRAADNRTPTGFPLIMAQAGRVVMGLDDNHLDFRLCVEKSAASPDAQRSDDDELGWLTVTTVVRTKRMLGQVYLAAIMPFHRLIARTLLQGLVAPAPRSH
ncbi:DUF2867 domain-containing protein [Herbaspirillum sp. NPDC087042]|uniref:DUF2867 domain-containing protein n=1 Tax=Herbaspirillum sp. NPDC087042 TaxID=3364004 RepID=UPI0037FA21AA